MTYGSRLGSRADSKNYGAKAGVMTGVLEKVPPRRLVLNGTKSDGDGGNLQL